MNKIERNTYAETLFWCVYTPLLLAAVLALCCVEKGQLHLLLCGGAGSPLHHYAAADRLMRGISYLAQWPLWLLLLIPLAMKRWREVLCFGGAIGLSSAIVHIIKPVVKALRPANWFLTNHGTTDMLPVIEGNEMRLWQSFPSGHTSSFFTFFTLVVLLVCLLPQVRSRRWLTALIVVFSVLLAALGGYSRIYLSQHFLLDVAAGSLIGVASAYASFFIYRRCLEKRSYC